MPANSEERAARLAWWLAQGERITPRHAAKQLGIQPRAVSAMLERLSRVVPITSVNGGTWTREKGVTERDVPDDG